MPLSTTVISIVVSVSILLGMGPAGSGLPAPLASLRAARPIGQAPSVPAGQRLSVNLASRSDYVAQTSFVRCVGASMQMMLNMIEPGADRSARTQRRLQRLARSLSGPVPDGFVRRGAGVRGWAAGLVAEHAGPYAVVGVDGLDEAMRTAATAIRTFHRPVGLLVWRGRHAWVMSGFKAVSDPRAQGGFRVTAAYILDPLYPHGSQTWGPSPRPGSAISIAAVGRQFVPRQPSGPWSRLPDVMRLAGRYVMVVPTGEPAGAG
jgi:hypothetical protein